MVRSQSAARRAHIVAWTPERDPEIRTLLQARHDAAASAYRTEKTRRDAGLSTTDFVLRLADLGADAEIDLAEKPEQVIQALERHLKTAKQFELEEQR